MAVFETTVPHLDVRPKDVVFEELGVGFTDGAQLTDDVIAALEVLNRVAHSEGLVANPVELVRAGFERIPAREPGLDYFHHLGVLHALFERKRI